MTRDRELYEQYSDPELQEQLDAIETADAQTLLEQLSIAATKWGFDRHNLRARIQAEETPIQRHDIQLSGCVLPERRDALDAWAELDVLDVPIASPDPFQPPEAEVGEHVGTVEARDRRATVDVSARNDARPPVVRVLVDREDRTRWGSAFEAMRALDQIPPIVLPSP